jgi:hypothetical protein
VRGRWAYQACYTTPSAISRPSRRVVTHFTPAPRNFQLLFLISFPNFPRFTMQISIRNTTKLATSCQVHVAKRRDQSYTADMRQHAKWIHICHNKQTLDTKILYNFLPHKLEKFHRQCHFTNIPSCYFVVGQTLALKRTTNSSQPQDSTTSSAVCTIRL